MINKKSNATEIIGMSFGVVLVVILVFIFIGITSKVTPAISNSFCPMSIDMRDGLNQFFIGNFFKRKLGNVMEDELGNKNPIPLLCTTNEIITKEDIEQKIADEFLRCYENMGKGDKTGIYPEENFVCSKIYFDAPSKYEKKDLEKNTVDLMKVYSLIINKSTFKTVDDFDNNGLDFNNKVRFCINSFYQQNILRNLYNSDNEIGLYTSTSNAETGLIGSVSDPAQTLNQNQVDDLIAGFSSSCLSLREAAVNDWNFNLKKATQNGLPNTEPFCKKICNIFKDNDNEDLGAQALTDAGAIASGTGMYSFINSIDMSKVDVGTALLTGVMGSTFVSALVTASAVVGAGMGPVGWVILGVTWTSSALLANKEYKECVSTCGDVQYPSSDDSVIDPDMFMFCSDMCSRECEESNSNIEMYNSCKSNCTFNCLANCDRKQGVCEFNTKIDGEITKTFNFTKELSNLFGETPKDLSNFNSSTRLGRGTFVIKYYDYSEWKQIKKIDTFYVSKNTYSNIIYNEEIKNNGQRDYFVIEYYPFIEFDVKNEVNIN